MTIANTKQNISEVHRLFLFKLFGRSLTGFELHMVTIEIETVSLEVKGKNGVGFGNGCVKKEWHVSLVDNTISKSSCCLGYDWFEPWSSS